MERKKLPFYSFGEGNEFAGVAEEWNHFEFGARQPVVFPLPKAVFEHTSRNYAGFDMNIPDWLRIDQFEKEFTEKWLTPKKEIPRLIALQLPNDHGAGVRPEAGDAELTGPDRVRNEPRLRLVVDHPARPARPVEILLLALIAKDGAVDEARGTGKPWSSGEPAHVHQRPVAGQPGAQESTGSDAAGENDDSVPRAPQRARRQGAGASPATGEGLRERCEPRRRLAGGAVVDEDHRA